MGLLDKLFKKGPKADEVSKGGSPIYRYGCDKIGLNQKTLI